MNEAAMAALDEKLRLAQSSSDGSPLTIKDIHFKRALEKISPSVSDKVLANFFGSVLMSSIAHWDHIL